MIIGEPSDTLVGAVSNIKVHESNKHHIFQVSTIESTIISMGLKMKKLPANEIRTLGVMRSENIECISDEEVLEPAIDFLPGGNKIVVKTNCSFR